MSLSTGPSLCERYHAATCYTPQSIQQSAHLDFEQQPTPFKHWHQARRVELRGGPSDAPDPRPGRLDAERLGRLLFHTYGVTLVREFPGMSMHFRAAPSAGGLYPTELYVAVRDIDGIPDGILDYHAPDHSLVVCWEGDFWRDLERYTFGHPAIGRARAVLIGTGVYQRSAWRYRDRAYRRVLLDAGHVFGNAVLTAPRDGQRVTPIPYFHDGGINGLLLVDEREEGALILGAVIDEADGPPPPPQAPLRSAVRRETEDPSDEQWIPVIHAAGHLDETSGAPVEVEWGPGPEPIGEPVPLESEPLAGGKTVLEGIRRRRSTRHFLPSPMPLSVVGRILAHAHPQPDSPEPAAPLLGDPLDTWIVVASVSTLPSGVYRYDAVQHALWPIRHGNPRRALYDSCLRQELGRDCAFAVVHTLDLRTAVARYGERVYRTAHLEAGLIGQRLNLAALQLGFGVSGIGGFFDHFLNALLMLPEHHAIAYITTIGVPA